MEVPDKLVAEFVLLRQNNLGVHSTTLLSALKLVDSEESVKLKIIAVLLDISNFLIRGKIDEEMLDLLETLEKLLLQEHAVMMSSLKSAYCLTAVECTVRFMWLVKPSDGLLGDALERIWKKRIGMLKERESDLVTSELLKWESDFKKAFEEPEIYQKIRETNIRYKAISYLNQLLNEQWTLVGCSTLEREARKRFLMCKDPPNASRERGNDTDKTGDAFDNVNEELGFGDKEGRERSNRENVEEVGGVENSDWTEKVNEQEQEHEEHEPSHSKGDETVAQELKEFLLEIQRLVDHPTRQEQESSANDAMDQSVDVTPQPNVANRTEAENNERTSSSERVRPHLPTPEPLNIPLLRKLNAPRPRRPTKFWSPEEVEALREGVKVYGKAWKDIKNSNPVVLAERTEVDLKDKWRNLLGR